MGQHKHNPNCQLAKDGKLPPKPNKISKREAERLLYAKCNEILFKPLMEIGQAVTLFPYSNESNNIGCVEDTSILNKDY